MKKLSDTYYRSPRVVELAQDLLGKVLCTRTDCGIAKVVITETEAYEGEIDRASHAFGGRRTPRTETMYQQGGVAYVYLCYGIHHLFNVVTGPENTPHAVLIRGGIPWKNNSLIEERRARKKVDDNLLMGPGKVSQGLGITTQWDGVSLQGNNIWIEDHHFSFAPAQVKKGPRIGVDYAGEHAKWLYRFWVPVAKAKSILHA